MEQNTIEVENITILSHVCGTNDVNIRCLEKLFKIPIFVRKNRIFFMSDNTDKLRDFHNLYNYLLSCINQSLQITTERIFSAYNQICGLTEERKERCVSIPAIYIPVSEKQIIARTKGQERIIQKLETHNLVFLVGPAGTGKTFLTTAFALSLILKKKVNKYVITRPVIEAGEKLGFLPGDLIQKVMPYLLPVYDALEEIVGSSICEHLQENKKIEVSPLAYMRGRTLHNSIVLLDEAQNCSPEQMKMFLTRIGEGSKIIVNGDITQSDLHNTKNGLQDALRIFKNVKNVAIVHLDESDIQRSALARKIVKAYNRVKEK